MAADTVQLVVERERALETAIGTERERIARELEELTRHLANVRISRIKTVTSLHERRTADLERDLTAETHERIERERQALAARELDAEAIDRIATSILDGFSWRPNRASK